MTNPNPKCSFCAKAQDEVAKLIAAPGVYICDECVDLCCEILSEQETDGFGWVRLPEPTLRGWGAPGSDKGVKIQ
jgi:hypothetical protein